MEKILTAKQFADQYDWDNSSLDIEELLRDFAKLHVKAAKEAWFSKIKSEGLVTEKGIAYLENAYPDDLIQ